MAPCDSDIYHRLALVQDDHYTGQKSLFLDLVDYLQHHIDYKKVRRWVKHQ